MSNSYQAVLHTPTIDSIPFWSACNQEQLLLQRCGECETSFYYARRLCPHCGSEKISWLQSAGKGTVFSCSEVAVSFFGLEWDADLPYTVVLVDLDEGPRMLSRMLKQDQARVSIGARVQVSFVQVQAQKLPFFELL
jgi:uncharacterized OB-fold protein